LRNWVVLILLAALVLIMYVSVMLKIANRGF
jgi:hypothetical protein